MTRLRNEIESVLLASDPDIVRAFLVDVEPLPDECTFEIVLTERSAVDQLADLADG